GTFRGAEFGTNAGDAETSVLLKILPDQVKMDKAKAERPPKLSKDSLLSIDDKLSTGGKLTFGWLTKDLSQSGVIGDPTSATKEKGQQILELLPSRIRASLRVGNIQP
ncbi:unnamed protein product, partial [Didymodactylos carnosus]